jgi:hypothetical protein
MLGECLGCAEKRHSSNFVDLVASGFAVNPALGAFTSL